MEKILSLHMMDPKSNSGNNNRVMPLTHQNELISSDSMRFFPSQHSRPQRVVKQQRFFHSTEDEHEEEEEEFDEEHDESMEVEDLDMEAEMEDEEDHPTTSSNSHVLYNNHNANSIPSTPTPTPSLIRQNRVGDSQQFRIQYSVEDVKSEQQSCAGSPTPHSSLSSTVTPSPRGRNNGNAKSTSSSWLASQPKLNAKSKSGYILFSAEVRKRVMNENPEAGFGEVSKIVGIEWKQLNKEQKQQYETRAQYIAEERAKAELLTPNSKLPQPGQIRVYCCRWQQCDFQFDTQDGLFAHIKSSHTSQLAESGNQYVCLWNSCLKYRKEGKPFPSLNRLHRHVKEKHLPTTIRLMFPNQRTKNYFVHLPPAQPVPNGGPHPKGGLHAIEDLGRFVHHPYGDVPTNAISYSVATPSFPVNPSATASNSITASHGGQQMVPSRHSALSSALGQSNSSTPARYMSAASSSTPKSSYGSSLLNGVMLPPQPSTSASSTHYVIQQRQTPSQTHQQPNVPQQTVFIPAGQQAIVVNGITVYIPANAQTIILPPGYTGPQQQQQIVVHTTQPPHHLTAQQHPPPNGPHSTVQGTGTHNSSSQPHQTHFVSAAAHSQPHQIIGQQHVASAQPHTTTTQHQHLVNGMPPQTATHISGQATATMANYNAVPSGSAVNAASAAAASFHSSSESVGPLPHRVSHQQQQQFVTTTMVSQPSTSTMVQHSTLATTEHAQMTTGMPQLMDPGRTVVDAPKSSEPVFLAPSNSIPVKRVLHSEAYVKYVESLFNGGGRQRTVSKWDKAMLASHRNTVIPNQRKLPYAWIQQSANGSKPKEEELVRALWNLRDHLIEGTADVMRSQGISVEASAPLPNGYDEPTTNIAENGSIGKKGN